MIHSNDVAMTDATAATFSAINVTSGRTATTAVHPCAVAARPPQQGVRPPQFAEGAHVSSAYAAAGSCVPVSNCSYFWCQGCLH